MGNLGKKAEGSAHPGSVQPGEKILVDRRLLHECLEALNAGELEKVRILLLGVLGRKPRLERQQISVRIALEGQPPLEGVTDGLNQNGLGANVRALAGPPAQRAGDPASRRGQALAGQAGQAGGQALAGQALAGQAQAPLKLEDIRAFVGRPCQVHFVDAPFDIPPYRGEILRVQSAKRAGYLAYMAIKFVGLSEQEKQSLATYIEWVDELFKMPW